MSYQQYPPHNPQQLQPQPPYQQQPPPFGPPGQPPHQPSPAAWVPPQPPKKSRMGLWISLGVVAALFTGCVALAASGDDPAGSAAPGVAREEPEAKIGDVVRDGKFSFTVTKTRRSGTLGENEFLREEAQGEFVIFNVTVQNHGKEPQLFTSFDQFLYVGDKKYNAETDLEGESFLNEINPGNTVKGRIAFDVPKGADPTRLELHDSAFSDGVTITPAK